MDAPPKERMRVAEEPTEVSIQQQRREDRKHSTGRDSSTDEGHRTKEGKEGGIKTERRSSRRTSSEEAAKKPAGGEIPISNFKSSDEKEVRHENPQADVENTNQPPSPSKKTDKSAKKDPSEVKQGQNEVKQGQNEVKQGQNEAKKDQNEADIKFKNNNDKINTKYDNNVEINGLRESDVKVSISDPNTTKKVDVKINKRRSDEMKTKDAESDMQGQTLTPCNATSVNGVQNKAGSDPITRENNSINAWIQNLGAKRTETVVEVPAAESQLNSTERTNVDNSSNNLIRRKLSNTPEKTPRIDQLEPGTRPFASEDLIKKLEPLVDERSRGTVKDPSTVRTEPETMAIFDALKGLKSVVDEKGESVLKSATTSPRAVPRQQNVELKNIESNNIESRNIESKHFESKSIDSKNKEENKEANQVSQSNLNGVFSMF